MDIIKKSISYDYTNSEQILNDGVGIMHDEDVVLKSAHKTIHVIPGESIKLTPIELKPEHIITNVDRLMYNLVSGKPKFGEIKLKKLFGSDDIVPPDWNQVNDIYLEKVVKEFSHIDLENGNVWYEPFNINENQDDDCMKNNNNNNNDYQNDVLLCTNENDSPDCNQQFKTNLNCNSMNYKNLINNQHAKYDHLLFEVYDKEKTSQILSKEVIHFSIQSQIINETILGLEVIENQVTPFTFSNFDIAGIDSGREYLVYKIIKPLEKNQGQLEHSSKPGVPVEIFTQNDLNRGFVLYHSPREIGIYPKDFAFTFIVTNDNRSDTFPETPFHIRVLPSNDQAPTFKEGSANIKLTQSGSITLAKELFDVEDPDTAIDNILFTIEKPPDNLILELRSKGQIYNLNKDESFTMQEIRNGTFRLIHNGINIEKDTFKISVSDGKHVTIKTFYVGIQLIDNTAPRIASNTMMTMNVKEGQIKMINRENLAFTDDKSSAENIIYILTNANKLIGKLYLRNKQLKSNMKFTQADIDLQNLKYEAPLEIGPITVNDFLQFSVSDKEGNTVIDQVLSINIEPVDNQKPLVEIKQPVQIEEGGYLVFNEDLIRIRDSDSSKEQLNIVIDSQPRFGYFENTSKGTKLTSFPLTELLNGFTIRYVQNDHNNKEPNSDSFVFHVTDGVNQSPTYNFIVNIELINDEKPVAVFETLNIEFNKKVFLTNDTLLIVDFDTKPDDLMLQVEELPKNGDLFLNEKLVTKNTKFSYLNVLNKKLSYKFTNLIESEDEIKFKISDGKYSTISSYKIKLSHNISEAIIETNNGLQGISGKVVYNHANDEPSGVTYMTYNVSDDNGNILTDQRFAISVRDDKLPPVVVLNKGLRVNEGKFTYLTRQDFDVKDDDTPSQNIQFKILTQPKFGILENVRDPEKFIDIFTYDDLLQGNVKYTHDIFRNTNGDKNEDDFIDLRVSDGKNEASVTLNIIIIHNDNLMPQLISTFTMNVKEFGKKLFTKNDINIIDPDTLSSELKIIITHPPQYGIIEKIDRDSEYQNINNYPLSINEFTLKDIENGIIYYIHKTQGSLLDRFGFVIFDGLNKMFLINGIQTSSAQVFNIYINSEMNQMPQIERNLGIDYLYQINGSPGRMITSNELNIVDKDDQNKDLIISITRQPTHGIIEHKDRVGVPVSYFSQEDINQNKLYYILNKQYEANTHDYILFDVQDSAKNSIKNNKFEIKWSVLNFEVNEITVMENEGKARVHILRTGNLKQYSMITCRTISDTAKSNRDNKNFDFIHTVINVEFNEGESYKACDIVIQKDSQIEPIESFYVVIEDPKYSVLGNIKRVKINILDKQKVAIVGFDRNKFEVQESDKLLSIPIERTGDTSIDVSVDCYTQEETARSNFDFIPRLASSYNYNTVKIPAGETFGFCDIELIDDDQHEALNESFKVFLTNPSNGAQLGVKNDAKVIIIGPNDVETDKCKLSHLVVSENSDHVIINIQRKTVDLNQQLEVSCTTVVINNTINENNIKNAIESEDFTPVDDIIRFLPGEQTKKCHIKILNDNLNPIMEGLKMFSVKIKPIIKNNLNDNLCNIVEPDIVHVTIDDTLEDSISVGFSQTNFVVQETAGNISIPIIRQGDLSQSFSLICFTRQLTGIEDKDYVGRYTLEQSRIFFEPGDKEKNCTIEIINDSIYEADETFQVKLSDLRGSKDAHFDLLTTAIVTITNEEDATILSLSEETYYTEEPSSNDSLVIKPITIVRTGDLSRKSIVRISTSDGTARAGKDYKSKTETITFEPGVSALDFDINILHDTEEEDTEKFKVYLGPQDPIAAIFGTIKSATVYIKDNNVNKDWNYIIENDPFDILIDRKDQLPSSPYLLSVKDLLNNEFYKDVDKIRFASPSYPLICIHACDIQHPYFSNFQHLCNFVDNLKILYSWEISSANEFGKYSSFVKLTEMTAFSSVNQSILESFYFRQKFRIRCTTHISKSPDQTISNKILKSNTIEINAEKSVVNQNAIKCFDKSDNKIGSELNFKNSISITPVESIIFDKSVNVRAEYISEDSSSEYKNRVKLSINLAYRDGTIPLISTNSLQNCRFTLNDQYNTNSNTCSNLINKSLLNKKGIKYGFIDKNFDNRNYSDIMNLMSKYRDSKTKNFYSNLDLNDCEWKFTAYYDLNELVNLCDAKLDYETEIKENGKEFFTLKIPLYISYVQTNSPSTWSCVEHKTEIETSLNYLISSTNDNFNDDDDDDELSNNSNLDNLMTLSLSKIKFDKDGGLIMEISTFSYFNGYFVKSHPLLTNYKSRVISPNGKEYDLELVWDSYLDKSSEQLWRIKSNRILKDYTGNYTIELIPCITDTKHPNSDFLDCVPKMPIIYSFPLILEEILKPLPAKYSLETMFYLSNRDEEIDYNENNDEFDGYFRKDDRAYGIVSWYPKNDLKTTYKLRIEKVYLCSTKDGHVPVYDPEGTYYKQGPQYGCSEQHDSITDRFLLLDRNNTSNSIIKLLKFNQNFITNNQNESKIIEKFSFDMKPLFPSIDTNETIYSKNWYIQVYFYIGPASTIDSFKNSNKRDNIKYYSNIYNFNDIYNNGTNIQKIKLTNKERVSISKLKQNFKTAIKFEHENRLKVSNKDNILKLIIPLVVIATIASIVLIAALLFKKYKNYNDFKSPPFPVSTSPSNSMNSTIVIVGAKADYSPKDGSIQTKLLKSDHFSDESNCTLQTVISSSTSSSTNSHTNMLGNENYSLTNNKNDNVGFYSTEKLKTFFKKMYIPVPTESDEIYITNTNHNNLNTNNTIVNNNRYSNINKSTNYLYFNYNNTDLNLNSNNNTNNNNTINNSISNSSNSTEVSKIKVHSSTRSLVHLTNSQKRLSGTEV